MVMLISVYFINSFTGNNIISYNADAANFYTSIYHYPAKANVPNGTVRSMWSWDYGTYLGNIPEASETYNVVGNVNEHGLIVTESTFGGLSDLACSRRQGLFRTKLTDYHFICFIGMSLILQMNVT